MICPECNSENTVYGECYDDYLDEDGFEHEYLCQWWDCLDCKHRVLNYDGDFEHPEDNF